MIPSTKDRKIESNDLDQEGTFGIAQANIAAIMKILRDTLYTDKVLAVLREYSANAWDSHRMKGVPDLPIKVEVPTELSPELVIRDYGVGLSNEDVYKIFTQYGASTKTTTNDAVGMMGIGSKCGFAYGDTFTVSSWFGGKHTVYVAVLDVSDRGLMKKLFESDCAPEETGVEIRIPVRPDDIKEFRTKARIFYQHFTPRPTINVAIPKLPGLTKRYEEGLLYAGEVDKEDKEIDNSYDDADLINNYDDWFALMGCVAYKINMSQIAKMEGYSTISKLVEYCGGVIKFGIGEVEVSASREELKYSEMTKQAVLNKMLALYERYSDEAYAEIASEGGNSLKTRYKVREMAALGLPVPIAYNGLDQEIATFKVPVGLKADMSVTDEGVYYDRKMLSLRISKLKPPMFVLVNSDDMGTYEEEIGNGELTTLRKTPVQYKMPHNEYTIVYVDREPVNEAASKILATHAFLTEKKATAELQGTALSEDEAALFADVVPFLQYPVLKYLLEWPEVREKIETALVSQQLDGCEIKKMTDFPWEKPAYYRRAVYAKAEEKKKREISPHVEKHTAEVFVLNEPAQHQELAVTTARPFSRNWSVTTREPTDNDVYMELSRFEIVTNEEGVAPSDLYVRIQFLHRLNHIMGIDVPKIYGYKRREGETTAKLKGMPFWKWQRAVYSRYLPDYIKELAWARHWKKSLDLNDEEDAERAVKVIMALGKEHPASKVLRKGLRSQHLINLLKDRVISSRRRGIRDVQEHKKDVFDARGEIKSSTAVEYITQDELDHVEEILFTVNPVEATAQEEINKFFLAYPLLKSARFGIGALVARDYKDVVHYIKLIDENVHLKSK